MGTLFHDFGRRLVDGEIRYPGGERINVTSELRAEQLGVKVPGGGWTSQGDPPPLVGSAGVVERWWVADFGISGWKLQRLKASFVGGQRVNVSMNHFEPTWYLDKLNWSVKPVGEKGAWQETAKGGEWRELDVPGDNGTISEYDFVLTSTASTASYDFESVYLNVLGLD
jgi:hypothetical protein